MRTELASHVVLLLFENILIYLLIFSDYFLTISMNACDDFILYLSGSYAFDVFWFVKVGS